MAETIKQVNALEDYKYCKREYGIYVNTSRQIPGVQDGLKKVTRRILQTCLELRAYPTSFGGKGLYKSARVVGDVLGKYHPHGDSSAYGNMKTINNDFEIYEPLSDGNGNWGNAFGDGAAAMRYTEYKLSEFAMDCVIGDLRQCKEIVDYSDNFSYTEKEIDAFPVKLGLLLINGAFGVGFGIQCSIPCHNTGDVIDAQLALLKDPNAPVVLIPDNPMGCDIVNTNWKQISNHGTGKYIERAKINIEEIEGHTCLVVSALPQRVFMNKIEKNIKDLIKAKKMLLISDLRYDNNKDAKKKSNKAEPFKYIIELKKNADPNYVKEFLYKNTKLQNTFSVNFEVLDDTNPDDIKPVRMSYKSYLQFVNERLKTCKFRMYAHQARELNTTAHMVKAFINIIQNNQLDELISTIRHKNSTSNQEMIAMLNKKFNFTPIQSDFILKLQLSKLSEGWINKYIHDNKDAEKELAKIEPKILDDRLLTQDIIDDLLALKAKYGHPRKSKVISANAATGIPEGQFKIVITNDNYIKKIGINDAPGVKGDRIKSIMEVDNTKNILLFDEQGKVFKLPIHKLPLGDRTTSPIDIRTILKNATSNINTIIYEPILEKVSKLKVYHYLTVMTTQTIKKLDIADFLTVSMSGLKYTNLNQGDRVVDVSIVADGFDILVYSKNKALRMNISEVIHQKRVNKGVKIMDTKDEVEGLSVLTPNSEYIIVITDKGKVNKINILALPLSGRAKAGSKVIKLLKGDSINHIVTAKHGDVITITTNSGITELPVDDIREGSSISSGEHLIKLAQGDSIISVN